MPDVYRVYLTEHRPVNTAVDPIYASVAAVDMPRVVAGYRGNPNTVVFASIVPELGGTIGAAVDTRFWIDADGRVLAAPRPPNRIYAEQPWDTPGYLDVSWATVDQYPLTVAATFQVSVSALFDVISTPSPVSVTADGRAHRIARIGPMSGGRWYVRVRALSATGKAWPLTSTNGVVAWVRTAGQNAMGVALGAA